MSAQVSHRPIEAEDLWLAIVEDLSDKLAEEFGEEVFDREHDDFWDWYEEHLEKPVKILLCMQYGHQPVRDHCNLPEHDHCGWCNKLMPHAAPR